MSLLACCLWWFVLGALAGWLLSWLVNRLIGRTGVREIPAQAPPAPVVAAATRRRASTTSSSSKASARRSQSSCAATGYPPAWSGNVLPPGRSKCRGSPDLG